MFDSESSVDRYDEQWKAPPNQIQTAHQFVLWEESAHQERVQIETFSQHPEVVAEQEVVKNDVKNLAGNLREKRF